MSVSNFISVAKQTNFNLAEMFNKATNESFMALGILIVTVLLAILFINKFIKNLNTMKIINKLQNSSSYGEYNENLRLLAQELPKSSRKIAKFLNNTKEQILYKSFKLLANSLIKEKINNYLQMSKSYELLTFASKKYNISDLTSFHEIKSKELLDKNLFQEIIHYCKNTHFNIDELENVNAIVKYANGLKDSTNIIKPLIEELNRFSYGYNLSFFKFIEKLHEDGFKQVYKNCKEKINELFTSGQNEVSINILDYLLENNQKQRVYNYITNLKLSAYLQQLYYLYFDKKNDINLDLAFVANPLDIQQGYKAYIDNSLTSNWRDEEHIEFISKAPRVVEVLGHMDFRSIIERIDGIRNEKENRKMAIEALLVAKRAETIALEAKAFSKQVIK